MSLRHSSEALGVSAFGERDRISAASKDIDVLFVRVRRTDSQSAVTRSIIKEPKVNACLLRTNLTTRPVGYQRNRPFEKDFFRVPLLTVRRSFRLHVSRNAYFGGDRERHASIVHMVPVGGKRYSAVAKIT